MPEKAWHANQRYAGLVTNIPHALHMPGHIYAQSDKIQEAISAFSAAAANEQKWLASDSLYPNGHYGHNVHFLIHALNLGGRYDDSMKWVQDLLHLQGEPARAKRQQPARRLAPGLLRADQVDRPLREVERDSRRQDDPGLRQAGAEGVAALGDGAGVLGHRPGGQSQSDARRDAEGSRRGDVGEGADRHRRCRSSRRRLRRAPATGRRPTSCTARRPTAKRRCSTPSRRRIRGRSSKGGRTSRSRSAITRPPRRPTAKRCEREPGSGRAFFGLAAALEGQGKTAEARDARRRAPPRRGRTPTRACRRCRLRTSTAAVATTVGKLELKS